MNVSDNHDVRRIVFVVMFAVAAVLMLRTYVQIYKIHTKKENNLRMYQEQCLRMDVAAETVSPHM